MMAEIVVDLMSIQIIAQYASALKQEVEGAVERQHLQLLQLVKTAIRVGLMMGIVMISTIIWIVTLMVEIAVDLMSSKVYAYNVNALNEEGKARIQ